MTRTGNSKNQETKICRVHTIVILWKLCTFVTASLARREDLLDGFPFLTGLQNKYLASFDVTNSLQISLQAHGTNAFDQVLSYFVAFQYRRQSTSMSYFVFGSRAPGTFFFSIFPANAPLAFQACAWFHSRQRTTLQMLTPKARVSNESPLAKSSRRSSIERGNFSVPLSR